MKRRPKDIGTAAETAVVRYLQANGWPSAERRALRGGSDAGDITGTPGVCWEVKARGRTVSDAQIADWLAETETERRNAGADVGVLVVRRAYARPDYWWAVLPLSAVALLRVGIQPPENRAVVADAPARLLLADAATLLRAAGYGNPIPAEASRP